MNRGKNSTQPHYPYQLPSPRSSTESRVSDVNLEPVSFTNPATELERLIKPEHTLQTPRSSTTSLDIPAPLVGPSQPGTHGGKSAVDNVREFLWGQHKDIIQVCRASTYLTSPCSHAGAGVPWHWNKGV